MEVLKWIGANWSEVLQSASFVVGAYALHREANARKLSNLIELEKHRHEIWKPLYERPELKRVLDPDADLSAAPLNPEEQRFVTDAILHLTIFHQALKYRMFVKVEGLDSDIRGFFPLPIPQAVWKSKRAFQNRDFVRFIEKRLHGQPRSFAIPPTDVA